MNIYECEIHGLREGKPFCPHCEEVMQKHLGMSVNEAKTTLLSKQGATKNIMMTVAFTLETTKTFEELTQGEILAALAERQASLLAHWEPEAIEYCDEYLIE